MLDRPWDKAPGARDQILLFAPTLDEVVPPDHPVRRLDACLAALDWSAWEARYDGLRGRPPLHPRLMAAALLYGLLRKVRSSRELEAATRERLDFLWLLEGRSVDHATFAAFRVAFAEELKDLHRRVARLLCAQAEGTLLTLVLDGTRERANSDRHGARTHEALERAIARCTEELDRRLALLAEHDARAEPDGPDEAAQAAALHREVATLKARVAQLEKALEVARARDANKRRIKGPGSPAVRVPVTDPDAQVVPNKDGGFAPNYTPTVAVDPVTRAIVAADVLAGSDEHTAVLPAVEAAQALGGRPQSVLADGGFAAGETLAALEARGVAAYMPTNTDFRDTNPARRPDPTQPVPEDRWDKLPRRNGKLASAAFVYDEAQDCHHCPMGRVLPRTGQAKQSRTGLVSVEYTCASCAGCPLAPQCLGKKATARTVARDPHQDVRDRVGRRMATDEGQARYRTRAPAVEGVFAEVKHVLGIRYFLLRGLEKVRTEWNWVCVSVNLKRLLALLTPPVERAKRPRPARRTAAEVKGPLATLFSLYRPGCALRCALAHP